MIINDKKMNETVSIILLNDKNQVLCVSRKDDHTDFGTVGGKVDPEDLTTVDAAIREAKEETGLDITNLQLVYANFKNGAMGYTYLADWSGEIDFDEPHVVKWGPFSFLIAGSFGKWNAEVYNSLKEMGINVFY